MSKKLSFKDACFQWASGFYLTEHLPDEWFDPEEYDEDEQNDHLENSLWQPFEFYDAKEITKEIESLAHWIENGEYPKKEDFEND